MRCDLREAYAYCPLLPGTRRKPLLLGKPTAAAYAGSFKRRRLGERCVVTQLSARACWDPGGIKG